MYTMYKTTNLINGKYYIGVTNGNKLGYLGSGTALIEAIRNYGKTNFKREILETFETEKEAFKREAEFVTEELVEDRQCYNMKIGGKGGAGQKKPKNIIEKCQKQ